MKKHNVINYYVLIGCVTVGMVYGAHEHQQTDLESPRTKIIRTTYPDYKKGPSKEQHVPNLARVTHSPTIVAGLNTLLNRVPKSKSHEIYLNFGSSSSSTIRDNVEDELSHTFVQQEDPRLWILGIRRSLSCSSLPQG